MKHALLLLLLAFVAGALPAQTVIYDNDFEAATDADAFSGSDVSVVTDPTDPTNQVAQWDNGSPTGTFSAGNTALPAIPSDVTLVNWTFRYLPSPADGNTGDFIFLGNSPNRIRLQERGNDMIRINFDAAGGGASADLSLTPGAFNDITIAVDPVNDQVAVAVGGANTILTYTGDASALNRITIGGNGGGGGGVFYVDDLFVSYESPDPLPTAPFVIDFEGADPLADFEDGSGTVGSTFDVTTGPPGSNGNVLRHTGMDNFKTVNFPFSPLPAGTQQATLSFRYYPTSVTSGFGDFLFLGPSPNRVRFQKNGNTGEYLIDNQDGGLPDGNISGIAANQWYDVIMQIDLGAMTVSIQMDGKTASSPLQGTTLIENLSQLEFGGRPGVEFFMDDISYQAGLVLPVELTHFAARAEGKRNLLEWSTAREESSDRFDVEHSTDGRSFTTIGRVRSRNAAADYRFHHGEPAAGDNYYRLTEVALDGARQYSAVVMVRNGGAASAAYPNPATHRLNLPPATAGAVAELLDATGRTVARTRLDAATGGALDVATLRPGAYLLRVTPADGPASVQKIMIK